MSSSFPTSWPLRYLIPLISNSNKYPRLITYAISNYSSMCILDYLIRFLFSHQMFDWFACCSKVSSAVGVQINCNVQRTNTSHSGDVFSQGVTQIKQLLQLQRTLGLHVKSISLSRVWVLESNTNDLSLERWQRNN